MFSGIVETTGLVLKAAAGPGLIHIHVERPKAFNDLKLGDSIAVDGICLTVEEFDPGQMRFALGPETLRVTGWTASSVLGKVMNLERSLRLADRLHGHLVAGHVDVTGEVLELSRSGETMDLRIGFPPQLHPFLWRKGSVAVNGVSLTLNQVQDGSLNVGLIPETLKRTNLGALKVGSVVNLEIDPLARGLVHVAGAVMQEKR